MPYHQLGALGLDEAVAPVPALQLETESLQLIVLPGGQRDAQLGDPGQQQLAGLHGLRPARRAGLPENAEQGLDPADLLLVHVREIELDVLAEQAGLSQRFIAQLEAGYGNISVKLSQLGMGLDPHSADGKVSSHQHQVRLFAERADLTLEAGPRALASVLGGGGPWARVASGVGL